MADEASVSAEELLVEGLRRGDQQAFGLYVARQRPALLGYIGRRLGDVLRSKVEADDIAQETAAAAHREFLRGGLGDRDPFGWLCHLAEQRIVDAYRCHVRSQKRSVVREARLPMQGGSSSRFSFNQILQASLTTPSQKCVRIEQQGLLMKALERLPAEQRDALRMHFLEGLPSKEIARRLGKEDVTVRVMISRCVQKLRRQLIEESRALPAPPTPPSPFAKAGD